MFRGKIHCETVNGTSSLLNNKGDDGWWDSVIWCNVPILVKRGLRNSIHPNNRYKGSRDNKGFSRGVSIHVIIKYMTHYWRTHRYVCSGMFNVCHDWTHSSRSRLTDSVLRENVDSLKLLVDLSWSSPWFDFCVRHPFHIRWEPSPYLIRCSMVFIFFHPCLLPPYGHTQWHTRRVYTRIFVTPTRTQHEKHVYLRS